MMKTLKRYLKKTFKKLTPEVMAEAEADMHNKMREAGFSPEALENDFILTVASATDDELIKVCRLAIKKYETTKDPTFAFTVLSVKDDLERRRIKDPVIRKFIKKNSPMKVLMNLIKNPESFLERIKS
jgi:hypothetical protein